MSLEHITADLVKIDINGSIYEIPRADVKAFIAGKTSAKPADDESKKFEKPKEAKKAKKIDAPEVAEVIEEIKSVKETEDPKDTKLQK